ncbi:hypothetical protein B0A58_04405 [Flavobacterium branchiophilum NBRC 15030 = ATCC 35035]|uniref:Uncharacterized protein n=1 Tax=Flavobacterium branchiophilum TaxID=55197 RepID=A0A543G3C4_9FLAO|nr:hypothetical protein [Flavobacterium branchiophilum]OXA78471.1 hypothetical protein B0A58_04405 [Flavobacterium branchiophilum NBRC 15030 = ATCC 35035]TQM40545.1 hypothetical protein BC670_1436 [Flavobacterium branchiophilum]GEM55883.1 hypothetical protein FB1_21040 [Flavobacterium branchiophilum NBRC 15030 = ATCC 35035]
MNLDSNYKNWISDLKNKIRTAQIKASLSVNEQMIMLYWGVSGFSQSNLYVMRRSYLFYKNSQLVHQASGQLQDNDFQSNIILQQAAVNLNAKLVQQPVGQIENTEIQFKN